MFFFLKGKSFSSLVLLCVAFPTRIPCWFLQVSDLVKGVWLPKNVHTTLQDPPTRLVAIYQPSFSFLGLLVHRSSSFFADLVAHMWEEAVPLLLPHH